MLLKNYSGVHIKILLYCKNLFLSFDYLKVTACKLKYFVRNVNVYFIKCIFFKHFKEKKSLLHKALIKHYDKSVMILLTQYHIQRTNSSDAMPMKMPHTMYE